MRRPAADGVRIHARLRLIERGSPGHDRGLEALAGRDVVHDLAEDVAEPEPGAVRIHARENPLQVALPA